MTRTPGSPPTARDRGRPRDFDIDQVVDTAARVFWEHGYYATSIDTLCDATGVFRGSLYRTFGDKHGVLIAAFDHYAQGALTRLKERLKSDPNPRLALREGLMYYTRVGAALEERRGCFITNSTLELLPGDEAFRPLIESTLQRMASQLGMAVVRGQQAGEFNSSLDAEDVARFLLCLIQGLRVLGKTGMKESDLVSIVEMAMRVLA
jgi:TetR/AcrR family transcriptional repressor of nem operon